MILRTLTIMRKELIHIRRDPRTMAMMFLIPVIQLVLLGYAATNDVQHLPTAILDSDRSAQSRALIDAYRASNYFDIRYTAANEDEVAYLLDSGAVRAAIVVPPGYGRNAQRGDTAEISVIIDGTDPNVANTALASAQMIGQTVAFETLQVRLGFHGALPLAPEVRARVWYNPEMNSTNFMIPGLIAMILQWLTMLLTAMSVVREREQGTIEQLIVTPIRPGELIVGKVIPYILIAFWDLLEILLIGVFWFHVPVRGSVPLLLALSALFLLTTLGMGILISTFSRTQQEAMMFTFFYMLPSIFLSGYFFPVAAMPQTLQWVSYAIPLTYALIIVRGVILKGVGLTILQPQVSFLAAFGLLMMALAARRFRKRLE